MFGLGPMELGVIAAICLIIFGPKQIPKLGKSIGETVKAVRGIRKEIDDDTEHE